MFTCCSDIVMNESDNPSSPRALGVDSMIPISSMETSKKNLMHDSDSNNIEEDRRYGYREAANAESTAAAGESIQRASYNQLLQPQTPERIMQPFFHDESWSPSGAAALTASGDDPSTTPLQLQSPFRSPARRDVKTTTSAASLPFNSSSDNNTSDAASLSLSNCRKVSVVLRIALAPGESLFEARHDDEDDVTSHDDDEEKKETTGTTRSNIPNKAKLYDDDDDDDDDDDYAGNRICVFPMVRNKSSNQHHHSKQQSSSAKSLNSSSFPLLHSNNLPIAFKHASVDSPQDLILVNPTAFGKHIPNYVTMETAQLVQTVAHIQSEDWARRFTTHHVLWPTTTAVAASHGTGENDHDVSSLASPLEPLATAIANDVTRPGSISHRTVISTGTSVAGNLLFGAVASATVAQVLAMPTCKGKDEARIVQNYGLLGLVADKLISLTQNRQLLVSMTIMEINEHDLFDLLSAKPFDTKNKVHLRHGASSHHSSQLPQQGSSSLVLLGLNDVMVSDVKQVGRCVRRALAAAHHKRRSTPCGHVMATLKIWSSTNVPTAALEGDGESSYTDQQRRKIFNNNKCTVVNFLQLAQPVSTNRNGADRTIMTRHTAFVRQSVTVLGSVLRGTLLKEAGNDSTMVANFRDSMLTQVLQRSMEHADGRVVVLANISPWARYYEETLATCRYTSRLLFPTGMLQSPLLMDVDGSKRGKHIGVLAIKTTASANQSDRADIGADFNSSLELSHLDGTDDESDVSSTGLDHLTQYAEQSTLLQNMIADPRQRLAKLLKPGKKKMDDEFSGTANTHVPTSYEFDMGDDDRSGNDEHGFSPLSSHALPTPLVRNCKILSTDQYFGSPVASAKFNHIEHAIDSTFSLDAMEEGREGFIQDEPSPLTADTGYTFSQLDNALDSIMEVSAMGDDQSPLMMKLVHPVSRGEQIAEASNDLTDSFLLDWGDMGTVDPDETAMKDLSYELFGRGGRQSNKQHLEPATERSYTKEMDDLEHESQVRHNNRQNKPLVVVDEISQQRVVELEKLAHARLQNDSAISKEEQWRSINSTADHDRRQALDQLMSDSFGWLPPAEDDVQQVMEHDWHEVEQLEAEKNCIRTSMDQAATWQDNIGSQKHVPIEMDNSEGTDEHDWQLRKAIKRQECVSCETDSASMVKLVLERNGVLEKMRRVQQDLDAHAQDIYDTKVDQLGGINGDTATWLVGSQPQANGDFVVAKERTIDDNQVPIRGGDNKTKQYNGKIICLQSTLGQNNGRDETESGLPTEMASELHFAINHTQNPVAQVEYRLLKSPDLRLRPTAEMDLVTIETPPARTELDCGSEHFVAFLQAEHTNATECQRLFAAQEAVHVKKMERMENDIPIEQMDDAMNRWELQGRDDETLCERATKEEPEIKIPTHQADNFALLKSDHEVACRTTTDAQQAIEQLQQARHDYQTDSKQKLTCLKMELDTKHVMNGLGNVDDTEFASQHQAELEARDTILALFNAQFTREDLEDATELEAFRNVASKTQLDAMEDFELKQTKLDESNANIDELNDSLKQAKVDNNIIVAERELARDHARQITREYEQRLSEHRLVHSRLEEEIGQLKVRLTQNQTDSQQFTKETVSSSLLEIEVLEKNAAKAAIDANQTIYRLRRIIDDKDDIIRELQVSAEKTKREKDKELREIKDVHTRAEMAALEKQQILRREVEQRHRVEEEVCELRLSLSKSEADRLEAIKIAEEAEGVLADLERRASLLEDDLEAQAASSIELEKTKNDLQNELDVRTNQNEELVAELAAVRADLHNLVQHGVQYASAKAEMEEEISSLKEDLKQFDLVRQDLAQLHESKAALDRENDILKEALDTTKETMQERVTAAGTEISRLRLQCDCLQKELSSVRKSQQAAADVLNQEILSLRQKLDDMEDRCAAVEDDLLIEIANKDALSSELEQTRDNLMLRIGDVKELSSSLKTLLGEKEQGEAQILSMKEAIAQFQVETRTKVQRVAQQRTDAVAMLEASLSDNETLKATTEQLRSELQEVRSKLDATMVKMAEVQSELTNTQDAYRSVLDENIDLKESVHALDSHRRLLDKNRAEERKRRLEKDQRQRYLDSSLKAAANTILENERHSDRKTRFTHTADKEYLVDSEQQPFCTPLGRLERPKRKELIEDERLLANSHGDFLSRAVEIAAYIALSAKKTVDRKNAELEQLKRKLAEATKEQYILTDDDEMILLQQRIDELERLLGDRPLLEESIPLVEANTAVEVATLKRRVHKLERQLDDEQSRFRSSRR